MYVSDIINYFECVKKAYGDIEVAVDLSGELKAAITEDIVRSFVPTQAYNAGDFKHGQTVLELKVTY